MSNSLTNYIVYNPNTSSFQDLSGLFQPYSGGVKAPLTYYNVKGNDLCNIFDPISVGTSINFNTNIKINGNDLRNIFAAYQQTVSYTATGNYTVYTNGIYTGIVFEYDSIFNGDASINFVNAPPYASLIMVGGGGGGQYGYDNTSGYRGPQPSGGGGGGVIYYQNLQLSSSTTYDINVGQGGIGATTSSVPSNGTNTTFSTFIADGGLCITSGNTIAYGGNINIVNGGGGGVGGYSLSLSSGFSYYNNGGTNTNGSNIGQIVYSDMTAINGGSSYFSYSGIPINIPFYGISAELLCGGGGGNGTGNGGLAGNGFGGLSSSNTNINGSSGYNSISQGYGGGGGGGGNDGQFPPTLGNGGNGGNGVVILYWPPYNILNSILTVQSPNVIYTPYYYNGYTGYVFNSGSGNITFNSDVSNATLILVGGGGAGGSYIGTNMGNGGGGGGGITCVNGLNIGAGTTLNFSIGIGGSPYGLLSTESSFGINNSSYNYISYGGGNGSASNTLTGGNGGGINTIYGGGGGGGGGGYNKNTLTFGDGGHGGSNSASSNVGEVGNNYSGGNSYYGQSNIFNLPFYEITTSIYVGGGGGGSGFSQSSNGFSGSGSLSGYGIGGLSCENKSQPEYLGQNGLNTINNNGLPGCFGGGGGGGTPTSSLPNSGYGGNGVLILYWNINPNIVINTPTGPSINILSNTGTISNVFYQNINYTVITLTGNQQASITQNTSTPTQINFILIGGGAGGGGGLVPTPDSGGGSGGGGGGAGGFINGYFLTSNSTTYTANSGQGGDGSPAYVSAGPPGNWGSNSVISTQSIQNYVTALGGYSVNNSNGWNNSGYNGNHSNGGSSGSYGYNDNSITVLNAGTGGNGGCGCDGNGNAAGNTYTYTPPNNPSASIGSLGNGYTLSYLGNNVYVGGGGAGCANYQYNGGNSSPPGALPGGGSGGYYGSIGNALTKLNGLPAYGGGGGGGSWVYGGTGGGAGGNGASGCAILWWVTN